MRHDPSRLRVVTSHPAKQVVVYEIASQLARHSYLVAHLAAVYRQPDRFPYNFMQRLPGAAGRKTRYQLAKRRHEALPDDLVVGWPWVELAVRALQPLFGLKSTQTHRVVDVAHDRFAARWVRTHRRIDIVMPHQGTALRTLRAARSIGARTVLVTHHPVSHSRILAAEYERLGLRPPPPLPAHYGEEIASADYFLTPSSLTTESLLEVGVSPARIRQIPWGVAPPSFARPAVTSSGPVRFLFIGKLSIHKGLHILREAWSRIPHPNITLTLIGRPLGDFEAHLVKTWADRRVRFVPEVGEIAEAHSQADVLVLPSLVEGFGMVTLEAMAAGLPVIVTDRSRAVVRDGVDGFIVPAGDAAALARCMIQLAEQPCLRAALARNARERAREYTWDRFGSELCDWLRDITRRTGLED